MSIANKKFQWVLQLALVLALVAVALPSVGKQTQPAQNEGNQSPPLIRSLKGSDLFQAYCASCHGLDARGTGPMAPVLKTKVPDLSVLTRNYHGQFPTAYVRLVILGDSVVVPHGIREMPIWGPIFHQVEKDMDWGDVRVANLIDYLKSIQSSDASKVPSGEELYEQDCAICHGRDLKGTGPAPAPFRAPADLTALARKHGGIFPDEYVANVVRNGVLIPAHGPAEMPIWGTDFARDKWTEQEMTLRVANLTNFIKAHQEK
ncbi:MAG: c-type cytochrome [Candidatus Acidiferrales bacterium]